MRIYSKRVDEVGFECTCDKPGESESWILFSKGEEGGLYIDKAYMCCEPELSRDNIRVLANWLVETFYKRPIRRKRPVLSKRGQAEL